jgi:hypothetical protein
MANNSKLVSNHDKMVSTTFVAPPNKLLEREKIPYKIDEFPDLRVLNIIVQGCQSSHRLFRPGQPVPRDRGQPSPHRRLIPFITPGTDSPRMAPTLQRALAGHANGHLYKISTFERLAA